GRQKWRKPYFQIRSPVGVHRQLPLQRVFHESLIAPVGNPYPKFSAKVVLACLKGKRTVDASAPVEPDNDIT
ncbi:hypothetical protein, partial [Komagataeibacter oboediens]|uniref:hypothetical protein n=1 Tax=Komagataeibacter oboediens TaxID=65958 RepID=UPI001F3234F7